MEKHFSKLKLTELFLTDRSDSVTKGNKKCTKNQIEICRAVPFNAKILAGPIPSLQGGPSLN